MIQLPPGASLARTDAVVREATEIIARDAEAWPTRCRSRASTAPPSPTRPNAGAIFVGARAVRGARRERALERRRILADLNASAAARSRRRSSSLIPPPPVRGIGTGGGFKMMVQDRRGARPRGARGGDPASWSPPPTRRPALPGVFSLFNTGTPKIYADIDRVQGRDARASRPSRCSRRSRSTSARPTSTTSTCSAAPSGSPRRPTARSGSELRDVAELKTRSATGDDGAARLGRDLRATSPGPTACRATTSTPRPRSRARPRPAPRPARRSPRWSGSPPRSCPTASATNGPSSRCRRSWPATPACWCSSPRSCSCSCCSPRSTRAGCCRSR